MLLPLGILLPQLAAPPGPGQFGHAYPPGHDVASLPGHAAPPGHDATPPPQACCSPMHATQQCSAKNRNLGIAPMDHYFVTKRFFLWEVFIHLALNFVTLFQKYFLNITIYVFMNAFFLKNIFFHIT
jgi:hypothetical protein